MWYAVHGQSQKNYTLRLLSPKSNGIRCHVLHFILCRFQFKLNQCYIIEKMGQNVHTHTIHHLYLQCTVDSFETWQRGSVQMDISKKIRVSLILHPMFNKNRLPKISRLIFFYTLPLLMSVFDVFFFIFLPIYFLTWNFSLHPSST